MLGNLVRAHRRRGAITQEELADRAGVSTRAIRDIESGRIRSPRQTTVRLLADAFDLAGAEREAFLRAASTGTRDRRSGPVRPAQLPLNIAGFTGRREEIEALHRLAATVGEGATAVVISAVSGTAGVGKTALAVHWAHAVADRFPDGQLYVNLRGFDAGRQIMPPAEALRGFLDALGAAPDRVPPNLDAQIGLYRSLIAGRRMLVVLDNARDAEQVRPLLPGTPAALAVVTSRNQLTSLVAMDGAHPLPLDVLSVAEARELLARRLGADRMAAEPDAVADIVTACARLPLALAIVAARARQAGFTLADLAAELTTGRRLDLLDAGDAPSNVPVVFSWSYTALAPPEARLFRLLGLHGGPDISAAAAASLAGQPPSQATRLLADLTRANLLAEHAPGRYACHDLLHAYAAGLAGRDEPADARRDAAGRLLDHFVHTAHAASRLLSPRRDPIPVPLAPPVPGTHPEHLADYDGALAWLTAERPALLAAFRQAVRDGSAVKAWQLAWATDLFLERQGHWQDWVGVWCDALRAAEGTGDLVAQAYAHRCLARAHTRLGRHDEAHTHYGHALDLFARAGDRVGQADVHSGLGYLVSRQDDPERALAHVQQALALYRAAGHRRGQALALSNLAWCHSLLGDHAKTLTHCRRAIRLYAQLGDRHAQGTTWDTLGYAHHNLGQHAQATDCFLKGIALIRDLGDRCVHAEILVHLGDSYDASGKTEDARAAWQDALRIFTDIDHPDAAIVHTKLTR
jgi:tetratricopeptide (TPR) repeat protein/transcriptional regulator with XRE-family HTH domain